MVVSVRVGPASANEKLDAGSMRTCFPGNLANDSASGHVHCRLLYQVLVLHLWLGCPLLLAMNQPCSVVRVAVQV